MKKTGLILLVLIALAFVSYHVLDIENLMKIKKIENEGKLIEKHNICDIYLHDQKVWYLWKEYPNLIDSNRFFLHIYLVDSAELPAHRKEHGCDNLDFQVTEADKFKKPSFCNFKMIIFKDIPTYKVQKIQTGMYNERERLWETKIVSIN